MMTFNEKNIRLEKLLEAAGTLFARWGFDKTTVEDIAREANISKGAVYLEFKGKDALFRAVVYRELARYIEDWLCRFEAEPEEWSFAGMFRHSVAAVHANPFVKGLVTRDRRLYGDFLKRDSTLASMAISMREELFGMLQRSGLVRDDISHKTLAYLWTLMGYGLVAGDDIISEENRVSFDDALSAFALLLDRGLSPLSLSPRGDDAKEFFVRLMEKIRVSLWNGALPRERGGRRCDDDF